MYSDKNNEWKSKVYGPPIPPQNKIITESGIDWKVIIIVFLVSFILSFYIITNW